ncbi:MAG TPA: SPFH domain-containing protein, partial [Candidatus Thermoplasmatota archaeon]|nr:SPFH domain-containing protein [Candidatus Thermoplasmatota archaeon]
MTTPARTAPSQSSLEQPGLGLSGPGMFAALAILALGAVGLVVMGFAASPALLPVGILLGLLTLFLARGFFILQPNEAKVITLFGKYTGTVRAAGWYWTNPFASKATVSLRVHNFNTPQLKVNDLDGNPIEIAAVIAWRVIDTARASFDVENYQQFVHVQAETAVRHLAGKYAYDIPHAENEPTLRGSSDQVMEDLRAELQRRL